MKNVILPFQLIRNRDGLGILPQMLEDFAQEAHLHLVFPFLLLAETARRPKSAHQNKKGEVDDDRECSNELQHSAFSLLI